MGPSGVGYWLRALQRVRVYGPGHSRIRFPVPSVFRWGPGLVQQRCFVCTPTNQLSGRRTRRLGPVRVCLCMIRLVGSSGPVSRARFGAPVLSFGFFVFLLSLGPLQAGVARFFSSSGYFCAPAVSDVLWFPAPSVLALGAVRFLPPPFFFFCRGFRLRPLTLWLAVWFSPFGLVAPPPRPLLFFCLCSWFCSPGAPCVFFLCFLPVPWFFFPFFFLAPPSPSPRSLAVPVPFAPWCCFRVLIAFVPAGGGLRLFAAVPARLAVMCAVLLLLVACVPFW